MSALVILLLQKTTTFSDKDNTKTLPYVTGYPGIAKVSIFVARATLIEVLNDKLKDKYLYSMQVWRYFD